MTPNEEAAESYKMPRAGERSALRFRNLNELDEFIKTQCGTKGSAACDGRGECPHYRHLITSQQTGMLVSHWSEDYFARHENGTPYCTKRKDLDAPKPAG